MPLSLAERTYHERQYDVMYRSTQILAEYVAKTTGVLSGVVLDAGCGGGANIHWLGERDLYEDASVLGIDRDPELVALARKRNPRARFEVRDFLGELPPADYVLSIQTLSFIEDWRPALGRLLDSARFRIYITSLFWDGVSTHTHATDAGHEQVHYNVIDAQEFERSCRGRTVSWLPFLSDLDPYPIAGKARLGSYTAGGHDFSGPLLLPWRIAMIK